jgi:hypothetical protein
MATATVNTTARRSSSNRTTSTSSSNHPKLHLHRPRQVLVTNHAQKFAALVTTCDDYPDEPLLQEIGSPKEMRRQAAELNRSPNDRAMGMRAYVCSVDVWLDR